MRQIALDTETTGLSTQEGHRVVEIGCVEIVNRRITGNNFHVYINPEREIDEEASRITGLTFQFLQDKPKFHEIVEEFFAFIGDSEVIIHNAPFDLGFINNELKLSKNSCLEFESRVEIFDTLVLARKLHPGQRNSLDALCKRYEVDNKHRKYHGALLDSELLAEVYLKITAGQINITFSGQEESNYKKNNKKKVAIKRNKPIKVIKATEEELQEHQKYIEFLENYIEK